MKADKIKNVTIIVLAVLLAMSVFTQVLTCSLLGVHSVDSLKQAMLANDLLADFDNADTIASDATVPTESVAETVVTEPVVEPTMVAPEQSAARVILDEAGIKITFVAVEYDTFWESYKLKFNIENNSATDVIINSSEEVVDGFMVDESIGFYCEVLAGKKAVSYFTLYNFDLETVGVATPGVFEFKLAITDNNDIFNTLVTSDKITINIT